MAQPVEASRVGIVFQAIPGGDDITVDSLGDVMPTSLQWERAATSPIDDIRAGIEAIRMSSYGLASGSALGASVNFYAPRNAVVLEFDEHRGQPMDRREHRRQAFADRAAKFRRLRAYEAAAENNPIVKSMIGAMVDALSDDPR